MAIDPERQESIRRALANSHLDLVICCSPTEVLLLTGCWPVIGANVAVFAADGDVYAIVPEDEVALAEETSAVNVVPYRPDTLDRLTTPIRALARFGAAFRHSTGHGAGFAAANANGLPRIHPKSPDVLDEAMTFNVEPAAYFDGYGGMRHFDVVAVTASGAEVLTEF